MLQKISISNKCCSFELSIQRILEKVSVSTKILNSTTVYDTEDWSNDADNSALSSEE